MDSNLNAQFASPDMFGRWPVYIIIFCLSSGGRVILPNTCCVIQKSIFIFFNLERIILILLSLLFGIVRAHLYRFPTYFFFSMYCKMEL